MLKRRLHCNTRLVISIPKSLTYFKVRKVKWENERICYTPQVCMIIFFTIWTTVDITFYSNTKFCLFYDSNLVYFILKGSSKYSSSLNIHLSQLRSIVEKDKFHTFYQPIKWQSHIQTLITLQSSSKGSK